MCCCSLIVLWSSATTMIFSWLYVHTNVWWMALSDLRRDIWLLFSRPPITVVCSWHLPRVFAFHWQFSLFLKFGFSFVSTGTANNAGAILVLGRDLVVVPKLIHPLPPAISSPETSPERHLEDTWMQVPLLFFSLLFFFSPLSYSYDVGFLDVTCAKCCGIILFAFSLWDQELNANRPPTPTRGRPQVTNDRGSLAWI